MSETLRLYYDDAYVREFTPQVVDRSADGLRLYFDRTACYPTSGGQPHDLGIVGDATLVGVEDDGGRVAHVVSSPVPDDQPLVVIDWKRRFDHMQQHTGQHLLSAVLAEKFGLVTLSFHLGAESSTIDVGAPEVSAALLEEAEDRCQQIIYENRPVHISYEHAGEAEGLRKASAREGTLRIVSIDGLDRSACGGTHVRATGEIWLLLLRGLDKIRGNTRIEFLCGGRAARQARRDYRLLGHVAKLMSAPLEEAPKLVAAQQKNLLDLAKAQQKSAAELIGYQAREAYAQGQRVVIRHEDGELSEAVRQFAQIFTEQPGTVFLQTASSTRAVLLAAAADTGLSAGTVLKDALQAVNGRGGGSARVAQGTIPDAASFQRVRDELSTLIKGRDAYQGKAHGKQE